MTTTIHRQYTVGLNGHGDPVANIAFTSDELRGIADALGDHDGGAHELRAIADRVDS